MTVNWLETKSKEWLISRLKSYGNQYHQVEEILAGALGYPVAGPDSPWGEGNHVIGEHDALSLAEEAARELERLYKFVEDNGGAT